MKIFKAKIQYFFTLNNISSWQQESRVTADWQQREIRGKSKTGCAKPG
jgi:hypothetical protein